MKLLMLFFFISSPVFAGPCGLQGTVEERIKDCGETKKNFVLIMRGEKGSEVYKDTKSNLIWGPRIKFDFNQYGSQKACSDEIPDAKMLKDLRWRLPTIKEFEKAGVNGFKDSLPDANFWFWTSTPAKKSRKYRRRRAAPPAALMWDGETQTSSAGSIADVASVRCVAKE